MKWILLRLIGTFHPLRHSDHCTEEELTRIHRLADSLEATGAESFVNDDGACVQTGHPGWKSLDDSTFEVGDLSPVIQARPWCDAPNDSPSRSIQMLRYGLAGISSCLVDLAVFSCLANYIYCCVDDNLGDVVRANRYLLDKTGAFLVANFVAYRLNAKWVFTGSRHHKPTEVSLFVASSMISHLAGMQISQRLIADYAVSTYLAATCCILIATVLNFAFRKMLIFQG